VGARIALSARSEPGFVRSEKDNGLGDFFRTTATANWNLRDWIARRAPAFGSELIVDGGMSIL
jgi:hypothetical protein